MPLLPHILGRIQGDKECPSFFAPAHADGAENTAGITDKENVHVPVREEVAMVFTIRLL
jgi:hypothetical protein